MRWQWSAAAGTLLLSWALHYQYILWYQTTPQSVLETPKVQTLAPARPHLNEMDTSEEFLCLTRTYHSADCDTDHSLVCCRVKLQPKKFHHNKQEKKPRIDVSKTRHSDYLAEFKTQFSSAFVGDYNLPSTVQWENVKNATLLAALSVFGKRKGSQQNDWYHSNSARPDPFIEAKHTALQIYMGMPSPAILNTLRSARSDVQKEVRTCINDYWTDLCRTIQQAADTGIVKGMYNGIKKATGPSIKKVPLKSKSGEAITDQAKQLDKWVEHYSELYSRENVVHQSALDAIGHLPLMPELDEVPSTKELSKAIGRLPSGKAPGKDSIPAEVIKSSKSTLLVPLPQAANSMLERRFSTSRHEGCQHHYSLQE